MTEAHELVELAEAELGEVSGGGRGTIDPNG